MNNQLSKTKLFHNKKAKNFEEENPQIYKKIYDSQMKKLPFYSQRKIKNNINFFDPCFEHTTKHSERLKKLNVTKNSFNHSYKNSFSDTFNKKFSQKKKLNTDLYLDLDDYNHENYLSKKNFEFDFNKILIEIVFKNLEIDKMYLEKMFSNKIDFGDLLVLNKDDLKEMNIPIGPRNRLLSFINDFTEYKENFKIEKIDLNTLNYFFKKDGYGYLSINKKNQISENFFSVDSPKINIKTTYNNNFTNNLDNNILINQEIKRYLYKNKNNVTINVNKTPYLKKNQNTLNINHNEFNRNIFGNHNSIRTEINSNSLNSLRGNDKNKNNFSIDGKSKKNLLTLSKKKKNSKKKIIPETNYINNTKRLLIFDYKNNNNSSKMINQIKTEIEKKKNIEKSFNSFSEEGLNLLSKMKKDLNKKLKNFNKVNGNKKLLLNLLETSSNVNTETFEK